MKFTFPKAPSANDVLRSLVPLKGTREYRIAQWTAIIQFVISYAVILWYLRILPPEVPIFYSVPWGEERLMSPYFLFALPLIALVIYGINMIAVSRHVKEHALFSRILFLSSAFVSIATVVLIIRIVTLIT